MNFRWSILLKRFSKKESKKQNKQKINKQEKAKQKNPKKQKKKQQANQKKRKNTEKIECRANKKLCKSIDWFLYDRDLRHERVKTKFLFCASECHYSSAIAPAKSNPSQVLFKTGVLQNFVNFTGKHPCWSLFLIKLQAFRLAILLKRHSNTDFFL